MSLTTVSAVFAVSGAPTVIVEVGGPAELFAHFGAGLLGGLLVFWLNQRSTDWQGWEDDFVHETGDLLLAMAEYERLANDQVPAAGTSGSVFRLLQTQEPEGYRVLRAAAAIHASRLTDAPARGAVRDPLSLLAGSGRRARACPRRRRRAA